MPLPDSGTLCALPLPQLLVELAESRFQGVLALRRQRTTKRIVLRDGAPIAAESNLASESLGVVLMDQGRLSRDDYARVVARVQQGDCKEGTALLELRLLEPKELFVALKDQLRRRILDCFGWPDGEFALEVGEAMPAEAQAFRVDPLALVQDGLSLHWNAERLLAALGDRLSQRVAPTPRLARLRGRLREDDGLGALVGALDGKRTLAEAIAVAAAPGALAAAWVLTAAGGLATVRDAAEDEPSAPTSDGTVLRTPELEIVIEGESGREVGEAGQTGSGPNTAAGPLGPEAEALREEVSQQHARMDELDHYALLGVARNAPASEVKRAYFHAAKRFHPDALGRLGLAALRAQAGELFARIAKAYAVLADPQARRAYDDEAEHGTQDDAQRLATAETLYRKGEVLVRKGAFREALQFLAPAVELWPDESAYRCALGWALYKQPKSEPAAAKPHLVAAVELDQRSAVAHERLGAVLRALGEREQAERMLARAKRLAPQSAVG